jgi:hypothetical protein
VPLTIIDGLFSVRLCLARLLNVDDNQLAGLFGFRDWPTPFKCADWFQTLWDHSNSCAFDCTNDISSPAAIAARARQLYDQNPNVTRFLVWILGRTVRIGDNTGPLASERRHALMFERTDDGSYEFRDFRASLPCRLRLTSAQACSEVSALRPFAQGQTFHNDTWNIAALRSGQDHIECVFWLRTPVAAQDWMADQCLQATTRRLQRSDNPLPHSLNAHAQPQLDLVHR